MSKLTDSFTIRITPKERAIIERLAAQEQRIASDVLRRLIRSAGDNPQQSQPPQPAPGAQ